MVTGKKHKKFYKQMTSYPGELSEDKMAFLQREQDSTARIHGEMHRRDAIHQRLYRTLLKKHKSNTTSGKWVRHNKTLVDEFDDYHNALDWRTNPQAQIRREVKRPAKGEVGAIPRLIRALGDKISDAKKGKTKLY